MKSLKTYLWILLVALFLMMNVSCSKNPSNYMMGFSMKMNKAIEKNDFKQLASFFGNFEDYGKLFTNLKTEKEMKKWKSTTVKSLSRSFSKTIRKIKTNGGDLSNIILVHMAYGAPQDASIAGDNKMVGYFSILPTSGYIVFKYYQMAGKDKDMDDGETMIISNIYYSDKKPHGKYKLVKQLCSDTSAEMFKRK